MNIAGALQRAQSIGLLAGVCASSFAAPAHKNVLFIISDDCSGDLGCWGNPVVKTPNLDALSKEGVRFRRAYCQFSVCNPSRASFLTGLTPMHTGVMDNMTDFRDVHPDIMTLPQYFREHGYWTGTIGKTFHVGERDPKSWNWCADWRVDELRDTKGFSRNVTGGKLGWTVYKKVESGTLPDDRIADLAIEKINGFSGKQPFFLCVGFIRPHDPYFAPKKFFDMYPPDQIQLPPDDTVPGNIPLGAYGWRPWYKAYKALDDAGKKELTAAYYACISYMDAQVGKVLHALKEKGLEENTIIVFLGDNGYHTWQKGWWGKCTVWEPGSKVPLIIAGDDLPDKNADCFRTVELLDVCPTLIESCGLPSMLDYDGHSLVPLLNNPQMEWSKWDHPAFTQFGSNLLSVRTERWRYCIWKGSDGGEALYDELKDPGETVNLISNPELNPLVLRLRELLQKKFNQRGIPPE